MVPGQRRPFIGLVKGFGSPRSCVSPRSLPGSSKQFAVDWCLMGPEEGRDPREDRGGEEEADPRGGVGKSIRFRDQADVRFWWN